MEDLIYCQRDIPKNKWRYGLRSSAATGCGWIATYNALRLMGKRVDIDELIRYFEFQVPLIHGNTGTSFWGPAALMKRWGFRVTVSGKRQSFDRIAQESDACILFYRWRNKLLLGAHFVALHKTDNGFVGYNTFSNSVGPDQYGPSLEAFLRKHGYFGAVLTGIRK